MSFSIMVEPKFCCERQHAEIEKILISQPRQHIKKQRHYFAIKDLSSQGCGFSSGHVWM